MTSSPVPTPTKVEPDPALRDTAAVVGIGHTDWGDDYRAQRAGGPDYQSPDDLGLAGKAFERALADAGLQASDIDGVTLTFTAGMPETDVLINALGVHPRVVHTPSAANGGLVPIRNAVASLASGECETVAMIYAAAYRAIGRKFGGATYLGDGRDSYYYYHPWGWSSQAAHWALMSRYYMARYNTTEADLGSIPMLMRQNAMLNEYATMRKPMTIDQYLESRYIVEPMHLLDMCLVNDGGACVILQKSDRAKDRPHTPVLVSGWGDAEVHEQKMHYMVRDALRTQMQSAGTQALTMAGLSLSDIQHFQGYDASSIFLVNQVEGYGFAPPGEGLPFCQDGHMAIGGSLPVNTSGGMLSEAYLHGWNHTVEAVRQLRHEAGAHQVEGVQVSMQSVATTDSAHPVIFTRGA